MNAELNISAVTWEGLDENLQKIMKDTASGIFTSLPGLLKLSAMGLVTIYPLGLTPAGRALLPAQPSPIEVDIDEHGNPVLLPTQAAVDYWREMSDASVAAHAATLERVKELEAENARLRAGIQAVLDNGLEHWASGDWYVQDEKSGKMWNGVREAAAGLKELLGK